MSDEPELSCPLPAAGYERVVLAHGAGGRLMHALIRDRFSTAFGERDLARSLDGAILDLQGSTAVSTDAFTVSPLFFPGGDIGSLAVSGTVNDLAMCGARPLFLTVSFVLEEGLLLADLQRIVDSMARTAREVGASVVTGDTKVVERGKGDGLFVTTTGLGRVVAPAPPHPSRLRPGDALLLSGPVGDHGAAVLAAREAIEFEEPLRSDAAPVTAAVLALYEDGVDVRCLRDPTRGGIATSLCELAETSGLGIRVEERALPVRVEVADLCELLGLDPLYLACEGRFVAVVANEDAERAEDLLRRVAHPDARRIGTVAESPAGSVVLRNPIGGERLLDMLSGDPLPRIC